MTLELCVVTDSPTFFDQMSAALADSVAELKRVSKGEAARCRALCGCASLLLVDEDPPDMSALELLRRIRSSERGADALVTLLACSDAEIDRVIAFELGVDDYVVKPIGPKELSLRLRAVLRRHRLQRKSSERLVRGPIEIELSSETVKCAGVPLRLTSVEFRLLQHLARRPGEVQSRAELIEKVWRWCDERSMHSVGSRTVDTHIKRLRENLGPAAEFIETIRGAGYRMRAAP